MTPVFPIEGESLTPFEVANPLRWIYRIEPVLASAALIAALPVAAVIAIVIAALSRKPPLIRHTRVGWRGLPLRMLKFRTMWDVNAAPSPNARNMVVESVAGLIPIEKLEPDPRVTSRFAQWCRRYSLDEIPQLYHVARGEMSFVGPRPITHAELDAYYGPFAAEILSLRPGLSGLWQIMGRNRLTYSKRRRLDLLLVRRASPRLYLHILWRTLPRVVGGYDAG